MIGNGGLQTFNITWDGTTENALASGILMGRRGFSRYALRLAVREVLCDTTAGSSTSTLTQGRFWVNSVSRDDDDAITLATT